MPEVPDTNTAEAALERHQEAIQAIRDDRTRRCNVPGTRIVEVSQAVVELIADDIASLRQLFDAPPTQAIDTLIDRGLAVWAAEKRVDTIDPSAPGNRQALFAEGGQLKSLAVKVLDLVAGDETDVARALQDVRPGTGYRDRADDLTTLHPHLDNRRDDLVARQLMTAAQIDRIGSLGSLLLAPQGDQAPELKAARLLHDKAFTYYYQADDEIRRHLEFLHWYNAEALKAYPKIFTGGRKKK